MPSKTFRWVGAYFGALLIAFFVFGVSHLLCVSVKSELGRILPIMAGLLVLVYAPRVLYMMKLEYDVIEPQLYEDLERMESEKNGDGEEVEEIDEDEDDDDGPDFPLKGCDGKDIPKKFT